MVSSVTTAALAVLLGVLLGCKGASVPASARHLTAEEPPAVAPLMVAQNGFTTTALYTMNGVTPLNIPAGNTYVPARTPVSLCVRDSK